VSRDVLKDRHQAITSAHSHINALAVLSFVANNRQGKVALTYAHVMDAVVRLPTLCLVIPLAARAPGARPYDVCQKPGVHPAYDCLTLRACLMHYPRLIEGTAALIDPTDTEAGRVHIGQFHEDGFIASSRAQQVLVAAMHSTLTTGTAAAAVPAAAAPPASAVASNRYAEGRAAEHADPLDLAAMGLTPVGYAATASSHPAVEPGISYIAGILTCPPKGDASASLAMIATGMFAAPGSFADPFANITDPLLQAAAEGRSLRVKDFDQMAAVLAPFLPGFSVLGAGANDIPLIAGSSAFAASLNCMQMQSSLYAVFERSMIGPRKGRLLMQQAHLRHLILNAAAEGKVPASLRICTAAQAAVLALFYGPGLLASALATLIHDFFSLMQMGRPERIDVEMAAIMMRSMRSMYGDIFRMPSRAEIDTQVTLRAAAGRIAQ